MDNLVAISGGDGVKPSKAQKTPNWNEDVAQKIVIGIGILIYSTRRSLHSFFHLNWNIGVITLLENGYTYINEQNIIPALD